MRPLLAGVKTEEPLGLAVSGASQQEHALAVGGNLGELVESEAGSLSLGDSVSGGLGELECDDSKSFRDVQESNVVGD